MTACLFHRDVDGDMLLEAYPHLVLAVGSSQHKQIVFSQMLVQETICWHTPELTRARPRAAPRNWDALWDGAAGDKDAGNLFSASERNAAFKAALQFLRLASQQAPQG